MSGTGRGKDWGRRWMMIDVCGVQIDPDNLQDTFINADCMDGLRALPDNSFDLAIVDPPYGINMGHTVGNVGGVVHRSAAGQIRVYGESTKALARQNFIIPSTTRAHRRRSISGSLNAFQKTGLYGAGISSLTISARRPVLSCGIKAGAVSIKQIANLRGRT